MKQSNQCVAFTGHLDSKLFKVFSKALIISSILIKNLSVQNVPHTSKRSIKAFSINDFFEQGCFNSVQCSYKLDTHNIKCL